MFLQMNVWSAANIIISESELQATTRDQIRLSDMLLIYQKQVFL